MRKTLLLALVVTAGVLGGCMLSPWDGMEVEDRRRPIHFQGYHLTAGQEVQVEAYSPARRRFEAIGPPTRADFHSSAGTSSDPHRYFDDDIFHWSTRQVIPTEYWEPGRVRGYRARVKATTPSSGTSRRNLMSVERDWSSCYATNKSAGDFARNCSSDRSPEAWIETQDYCDSLPELDIRPSWPPAAPTPAVDNYCSDGNQQLRVRVGYIGDNFDHAVLKLRSPSGREWQTACRVQRYIEGMQWVNCRADWPSHIDSGTLFIRARDKSLVARGACNVWSRWIPLELTAERPEENCPSTEPPPPPPPEPEPEPEPEPKLLFHEFDCNCVSPDGDSGAIYKTREVAGCINANATAGPGIAAGAYCAVDVKNYFAATSCELIPGSIRETSTECSAAAPGVDTWYVRE